MNQASRLLRLLALTAAFLVLTASVCEKKTPERQWERGAFQPLPGNTQTYQLPAGVSIVTTYGYDDFISKSDLPLLMTVRNSGSSDIEVTFPAGLVFGASNLDYQYMILLQDYTFTAAGGTDQNEILPTYCCNEDVDEPDEEAFYITPSGREWDREIEELLNLVADKQLSGDDAVMLAQDALFEITDGDSLTNSTRTLLQNLP